MHPERASFLASHLLGERPAFGTLRRGAPDIYFCRSEIQWNYETRSNNHDRRRSASRSPKPPLLIIRAARENLATNETEKHRKFSNTRFLSYKKTIFWGRFHFARRPSPSAESAIPSLLRFLEQTSLRRDQKVECSLPLPNLGSRL